MPKMSIFQQEKFIQQATQNIEKMKKMSWLLNKGQIGKKLKS